MTTAVNRGRAFLGLVVALVVASCDATVQTTVEPTPSQRPMTRTPTITITIPPSTTPSPMTIPSPTATETPAFPSPTAIALVESTTKPPVVSSSTLPRTDTAQATTTSTPTSIPGCLCPPDDYDRVTINGETLNARTLWMLQQAAALYDGPGDLLRVTQGSYTTGESSSFDTHAGGGAVDISIRNPTDPDQVLWDETETMVLALRQVGFAAWYRAPGDLGPGSPAHIHAIAIGDRELSPAAIEQVTGPGGYLEGFDGLPPKYGGPHPDPHGGPIICPWMEE